MKHITGNKDEVQAQKPLTSSQRMMHHILPSHWAKRETHTGQKGRR